MISGLCILAIIISLGCDIFHLRKEPSFFTTALCYSRKSIVVFEHHVVWLFLSMLLMHQGFCNTLVFLTTATDNKEVERACAIL